LGCRGSPEKVGCSAHIHWKSVQQLRDRLIIILRVVHLMRSVDLERITRNLATQNGQHFILIRRKGQLQPSWEPLVEMVLEALRLQDLLALGPLEEQEVKQLI
jgi:hypothetical protein